jgi:hypothetical protein
MSAHYNITDHVFDRAFRATEGVQDIRLMFPASRLPSASPATGHRAGSSIPSPRPSAVPTLSPAPALPPRTARYAPAVPATAPVSANPPADLPNARNASAAPLALLLPDAVDRMPELGELKQAAAEISPNCKNASGHTGEAMSSIVACIDVARLSSMTDMVVAILAGVNRGWA